MDLQYQCRNFLSAAHLLRTDDDVSPAQIDLLKDLALSFDEKLYKCEDLTSIKMRVEEVSRAHFDTLFAHLPLETSHSIATTNAADFTRHTPTDTRQLVYEVLRVAMRRLQSRNKFVDLGHGIGKAIMAAILVADFREYHGIEILRGLHDTSNLVLAQFNQHIMPLLSMSSPQVNLRCGSFLSPDISATWPMGGGVSSKVDYFSDWTDADVVFANSTCFPSPLMRQIEIMCRELKTGSRVITFTTALSSEFFKIIFKKQLFMSWGPATVYIHERLSSSEVEAGRVDRVELLSPRYRKWANPSPLADKNPPAVTQTREHDVSLHVEVASSDEDSSEMAAQMSTATARVPSRPTLMGKNHTKSSQEGPGSHSSDSSSSLTPPSTSSGSHMYSSPTQGKLSSTPSPGASSRVNTATRGSGPGDSSVWDPDTPTLKNWAREQLLASQSELQQLRQAVVNNGISSDSESADSFSSGSGSSSMREASSKSDRWQRGSTSIDTSTSSDEGELDDTDLDFRQMNIGRFAYYNDGKVGGDEYDSDSDGDSENNSVSDSEYDDEDDDNNEEEGDNADSDIDNDIISANLESYYHVKDDSDEDVEDEDDVDEMYDDSS